MEIYDYLDLLSVADHQAGGGSTAGVNSAMAASLILKAYNMIEKADENFPEVISYGFYEEIEELRDYFVRQITEDGKAFGRVLESWKLPKNTAEEKEIRNKAAQEALKNAVETPLDLMVKSLDLLDYINEIRKHSTDMIDTELNVSRNQIIAAVNSAVINFDINLKYIKDSDYVEKMKQNKEDVFLRLNEMI